MTDGLKEKERRIHAVLRRFTKVERGILFGSRALGAFRAASDVDLALEGDDIRLPDLLSLRAKIADLNLPIEVEFVVRNRIKNPAVEEHIRRYGIEWYQKPILRLAEEARAQLNKLFFSFQFFFSTSSLILFTSAFPPMSFDLQTMLESKRALRRTLAARPIGEKLRLLDALRERELAIRGSKPASVVREEPEPPPPSSP